MCSHVFTAVMVFVIAFVLGAFLILDVWEKSAERGMFEIGHKIYKVEKVQ